MTWYQKYFFVLYTLMVPKTTQIEAMALICGRRAGWIAERMEHIKDTLNLRHRALMQGSVRRVATTYGH